MDVQEPITLIFFSMGLILTSLIVNLMLVEASVVQSDLKVEDSTLETLTYNQVKLEVITILI